MLGEVKVSERPEQPPRDMQSPVLKDCVSIPVVFEGIQVSFRKYGPKLRVPGLISSGSAILKESRSPKMIAILRSAVFVNCETSFVSSEAHAVLVIPLSDQVSAFMSITTL